MSNNLTKTQIVGAPIYIGDFSKDSVANFEAQYNGKLSWEINDIQPSDGKEVENPKRARTMTFIPFDSEYYISAENGVRFTIFFYIKKDSNNDNDSFENYSYRGHSDRFTDSVDFYDHVGEKITHFRIAAKTSSESDITNINLDIGENIKLYKRVERNSLEWKNEESNVVTKDYLSFDPNLMVKYSGSERVEVTFFQKTPNGYGEINPDSPKVLLNGSFDFIDYDNIKTATHYKITIKNTFDILNGNNIKIYEKVHGIKKEIDKIKKIVEDHVDKRYYKWKEDINAEGKPIYYKINIDTGIEEVEEDDEEKNEKEKYSITNSYLPFDEKISIIFNGSGNGFEIFLYTYEAQTKNFLYQKELTKAVSPAGARKSINFNDYKYLKDYDISYFRLQIPFGQENQLTILNTEPSLVKQVSQLKEQNNKNLQLIKKLNAQLNGNYMQNQLFYTWKRSYLYFTFTEKANSYTGELEINGAKETENSNYYISTDYIPFNNNLCLTTTDFREVQLFFYERKYDEDTKKYGNYSFICPTYPDKEGWLGDYPLNIDENYSSYKNLNDYLVDYYNNPANSKNLLFFRISARHVSPNLEDSGSSVSKISDINSISRYIKINERIDESEIIWDLGTIQSADGAEVSNPYRTRSGYIPFDPTITIEAINDRRILIYFYSYQFNAESAKYEYKYLKINSMYFEEKINLSDYKFMLDQGATHFRIVLKHDELYLKDASSSSRYIFIYSNEIGLKKDVQFLKMDNPTEISMVPENKNVEKALKKAKQMAGVSYVTQNRLPNQTIEITTTNDGKIAEDTIIRGVLYSSAKFYDKMVGQNVSLHTYMTAMHNSNSILYTKDLRKVTEGPQSNCATYYGAVCSSLVGYCYNLPCNVITGSLKDWGKWSIIGEGQYVVKPEDKLMEELNKSEVKPGDFLLQEGHVRLITGVTRDGEGKITSVEVTEAKTPSIATSILQPGQYNALFTASNPYKLYRYKKLYEADFENNYEPIPYFALPNENLPLATYSDIISEYGDQACVLCEKSSGKLNPPISFEIFNKSDYTHYFINGEYKNIIPDNFILTFSSPGKKEVVIANSSDLNNATKKASTTITLINPEVSITKAQGSNVYEITLEKTTNTLYTPYYFAIADDYAANLYSIPFGDLGDFFTETANGKSFKVDIDYFQNVLIKEDYNKKPDGSYYEESDGIDKYSKAKYIKIYYQIKGETTVVAQKISL